MKRARQDGFYFLLLGSAMLLLLGFAFWRLSPDSIQDFKGVYYGARCLIQHGDPYRESEMLRVYKEDGGRQQSETLSRQIEVVTWQVYLPTTYLVVSPLALLACNTANMLCMIFTAGSLIIAAILVWRSAADSAPILCGVLIGYSLANCGVLVATGNLAGIVASLCIFAVWCFLNEQFVPAGIVCLAITLVIKPHDTGFIWLYFLLAGGANRRRALQTLALVGAIGLAANFWVSQISPHWFEELHANLSRFSARGQMNDLGPAGVSQGALDMKIGLQTIISVFRDNPKFYNELTYAVCGALLLIWLVTTLRSPFSKAGAWFALAAVAPLTMLVTYHRSYDAKLLLLTIPACAILWAKGGPIGWLALLINTMGFVLTGEVTMEALDLLDRSLHISSVGLSGRILTVVMERPITLILLVMCVFYLWVYAVLKTPTSVAEETKS